MPMTRNARLNLNGIWGRKTERKKWPSASPNTASGIAPLLRFAMRGRAKQIRHGDVEGVRQFHQILKGRVSQRTLNSCEVGSVHLCLLSQLLLRPFLFSSEFPAAVCQRAFYLGCVDQPSIVELCRL